MSANHSNTALPGLGRVEGPDWTARLGKIVRATLEAMDTGRAAQHDYRKLAARGLPPQEATRLVQDKHFSKRP